jgi:hypothetical protein
MRRIAKDGFQWVPPFVGEEAQAPRGSIMPKELRFGEAIG